MRSWTAISALLSRLDGTADRDLPLEARRQARRQVILNLIIGVAIFNCLFFVVLYSAMDAGRYWIAILANLGVAGLFAGTLLARRYGALAEALWFLATVLAGMSVFGFLLGRASGSHLILLSVAGIGAVLIPRGHIVLPVLMLVLSWLAFITADLLLPEFPSLIPMRPDEARSIFFATSAITAGVTFIMIRTALRTADRAEAALDAAFLRSEALLANVMPVSVAERLKRGETVGDAFDSVTVLFADVVGFSRLARDRSPGEVVAALSTLFSQADELARHHGCEKIKTIGDGIMVAAGLPEERADHAEACLAFAVALRKAAGEIRLGGEWLALRIGIQSGEVVAGILGTERFAYDLWGDTVNRAARLQAAAEPGEILLSEATVARLPEGTAVLRRVADIEMKNMGAARAWALDEAATA